MKHVNSSALLLLAAMLAFGAACRSGVTMPTSPSAIDDVIAGGSAGHGSLAAPSAVHEPVRATKVDVCHRNQDTVVLISVAESAVAAHLAHGDGTPGSSVPDVPGAVFDEHCVPVVVAIQLLFDNGPSSGFQQNTGNTVGVQELFEDFTLGQNAVITTIRWQQHDHILATYVDTDVVVFSGLPLSGPPLFRATVVANRTPNLTGRLFSAWDGFDYEIDGLSIGLPAGSYWLGLNARFQGVRSGWDNTIGEPVTIPGFRIVSSNFPAPGVVSNRNLAFRLLGRLQ